MRKANAGGKKLAAGFSIDRLRGSSAAVGVTSPQKARDIAARTTLVLGALFARQASPRSTLSSNT
jgi:hypothetical protein